MSFVEFARKGPVRKAQTAGLARLKAMNLDAIASLWVSFPGDQKMKE